MKGIKSVFSIALVCHEANRAYCLSIGDMSQPRWEDAEEWQKQSAEKGVEALMADPSLSPEQLHQLWCEEKSRTGWKYGPEKDAGKKEHPCLVPYDQLPEEQRMKDHLFHAVVRTLAQLPPGYVHV